MKIIINILIISIVGLLFISYKYKDSMKYITLPEIFHNTVGNIPLIEALDDGKAYFNNTSNYCDDRWDGTFMSCMLKFDYSWEVSKRIAKKEFLKSCRAGNKAKRKEIKECQKACEADDTVYNEMVFVIPLRACKEVCFQKTYVPECDKARMEGARRK